jgi:hypothetical protein
VECQRLAEPGYSRFGQRNLPWTILGYADTTDGNMERRAFLPITLAKGSDRCFRLGKSTAHAHISAKSILLGHRHLAPINESYVVEPRFAKPELYLFALVSVGKSRCEAVPCCVERSLICVSLDRRIT